MNRVTNSYYYYSIVRRGPLWTILNKASSKSSQQQQRGKSQASLYRYSRYCSSAAMLPGLIERTALRRTSFETSGRRSLWSYTRNRLQDKKEENTEGVGGIVIKKMTLDDLRTAVEWARADGWNPGQRDAEAFFAANEKGFFMAKTAGGDPVASIAAVSYGEDYGYLGLLLCVPEHRGKGYGKVMNTYAMHHLEGKKIIGGEPMAGQLRHYVQLGFTVAHDTIGFSGVIDLEALPTVPIPTGETGHRVLVENLRQHRLGAIFKFDEKHVPATRERFLRAWLTTPGHVVRVAVNGEDIKGYGVLRPCCDGSKIGPLFAESVEVAELLLRSLVSSTSRGTKVVLEIPEPNQASIELVKRLGLTKMWKTFRIYRGPAPKLPLERIYAVTCLQLG